MQTTILKSFSSPLGSVENRHRDERQTGIYPIPGFVGIIPGLSDGTYLRADLQKISVRNVTMCNKGTRENGHQTVFECPETAGLLERRSHQGIHTCTSAPHDTRTMISSKTSGATAYFFNKKILE
jgi:hypothetical protein